MTPRARSRVTLQIDGLTGVHATRAVWTALAGVAGVVAAEVSMAGVRLEMDGPLDRAALEEVLDAAGVRLLSVRVDETRVLPIL